MLGFMIRFGISKIVIPADGKWQPLALQFCSIGKTASAFGRVGQNSLIVLLSIIMCPDAPFPDRCFAYPFIPNGISEKRYAWDSEGGRGSGGDPADAGLPGGVPPAIRSEPDRGKSPLDL